MKRGMGVRLGHACDVARSAHSTQTKYSHRSQRPAPVALALPWRTLVKHQHTETTEARWKVQTFTGACAEQEERKAAQT